MANGYMHSCAISSDALAFCWGGNSNFQVGDGSNFQRNSPTLVANLFSSMSKITAGFHHSCGLTTAGAMYCLGDNTYGQLGDGSTTTRVTPQPVVALAEVSSISAGYQFTCALTTAGAMYCWGDNAYGQVGDGTSGSGKLTPTAVSGMSAQVDMMATGQYHACSIITWGTLSCWGRNSEGQVGDSTLTSRSTPTAISMSGFVSVAAGSFHTCAVNTGRFLYCWGDNGFGQLGDGTNIHQIFPALIATDVFSLCTGHLHTCILNTEKVMYCWGDNTYRQIGDGTSTSKVLVPTAVANFNYYSPTNSPTREPTSQPSTQPSQQPSSQPSSQPIFATFC